MAYTKSNRGNPENLDPVFSTLAHALKGIDLPQDKQGLKTFARHNNADDDIMDIIESLPDQEYRTMADVIAQSSGRGDKNERY